MFNQYGTDAATPQQVLMRVLSAGARTKGDVVYWTLGETGPVDVTITDNAAVHRIGVWVESVASGERGLICIEGPVQATVSSDTYTAGNGIDVDGGVVMDSGGAFGGCVGDASTDFAVALEDGTTVTTLKICLAGGNFTSQT